MTKKKVSLPKKANKKKPVKKKAAKKKAAAKKAVKKKENPRARLFIHNYFYDELTRGNATQSAVLAGYKYSTADSKAPSWVGKSRENASNKKIWDMAKVEREKIEESFLMSENDILKQYSMLCNFDVRKLYDKEGKPIPIHQLDYETAAAISGVELRFSAVGTGEEKEFYETQKIKIIEKKGALDSYAKIKGMFKQNQAPVPVDNPDDEAKPVKVTIKVEDGRRSLSK